jgi:hypothetical protein
MTGAHLKVSFNQSFALRCSELGKRVGADGERKATRSYPTRRGTPSRGFRDSQSHCGTLA